ncbi:TrbL/VirB6 plasmid conjugal transfer protein [Leptospirillum ferriphilum]|uniref:TrbL/VirB6 plasmid conjugal transfer protein n=1 Tax=Leptospirillum ferriphilum TaxID=178606 RepID=A0A094WDM2_9BACT|nr:type IV secretion system protein [Leptospirillum ferriphilum]KGA93747.1 TrbL/VirB6 plasmid conjugal transfer protein [Leptospirillum ferriphilum]
MPFNTPLPGMNHLNLMLSDLSSASGLWSAMSVVLMVIFFIGMTLSEQGGTLEKFTRFCFGASIAVDAAGVINWILQSAYSSAPSFPSTNFVKCSTQPNPGQTGSFITMVGCSYAAAAAQFAHTLWIYGMSLFKILATIEIAWAGFSWATELTGGSVLALFTRELLILSIWFGILAYGPEIMQDVIGFFETVGATAANQSWQSIQMYGSGYFGSSGLPSIQVSMDPGTILHDGILLAGNILTGTTEAFTSIISLPVSLFAYPIAAFVVLVSFAILALEVIIVYFEAMIVSSVGMLFLGFGGSKITRSWAHNQINAMVAAGVKLLVVSFLVSMMVAGPFRWARNIVGPVNTSTPTNLSQYNAQFFADNPDCVTPNTPNPNNAPVANDIFSTNCQQQYKQWVGTQQTAKVTNPYYGTVEAAIATAIGSLVMALLVFRLPSLAASIISGSMQMSSGSVVSSAAGMAGSAVMMASAAGAMTKAASNIAQSTKSIAGALGSNKGGGGSGSSFTPSMPPPGQIGSSGGDSSGGGGSSGGSGDSGSGGSPSSGGDGGSSGKNHPGRAGTAAVKDFRDQRKKMSGKNTEKS